MIQKNQDRLYEMYCRKSNEVEKAKESVEIAENILNKGWYKKYSDDQLRIKMKEADYFTFMERIGFKCRKKIEDLQKDIYSAFKLEGKDAWKYNLYDFMGNIKSQECNLSEKLRYRTMTEKDYQEFSTQSYLPSVESAVVYMKQHYGQEELENKIEEPILKKKGLIDRIRNLF